MKAYLKAFVNFKQNDWARFLLMTEFTYNNAKNASTGHMPFELNYEYYPWMSYEIDIYLRSKSKLLDKLLAELQELMTVCQKNLYHAQKFQKQAYDKGVKPKTYVLGHKIWLNSKYLKTKQNQKLEAKFFRPFQVLHLVGKQAYKLKLTRKWRIHGVFYVSLLEQDTTRKERMDEKVTELDFEAGNSEKYKVKAIWDSAVYAGESKNHQPKLYYLVA